MIGDFIQKMKLVQQDSKERLSQLLVDGQADNGNVKVVVDGNKVVRQILISPELFAQHNKEAIEELTMEAINKALQKVEEVYNEEIKGMVNDVPDIPEMNK